MSHVITVIPVYNGERYLGPTLNSVAAQVRRPDFLVVIDDCSTDGTRELVKRFQAEHPELKCELRQNQQNQGLFGNLNLTLQLAKDTDYLHILLADDLVLPEFLSKLVPALESAKAPSLSFSLTEAVDQNGQLIPFMHNRSGNGVQHIGSFELLRRQSELQTLFCGSVVLKTNRQPLPTQFRLDMAQTADCVFYAEMAQQSHDIVEVGEVLCQIRSHPHSATSQNKKGIQHWVLDEWKAMELAKDLMPETGFARWLRGQKLRCLFAARSQVKIETTPKESSEFANQIRVAARSIVRPHHWVLGRLAVALRNMLK
jgi:Glycosyl transferase family 2